MQSKEQAFDEETERENELELLGFEQYMTHEGAKLDAVHALKEASRQLALAAEALLLVLKPDMKSAVPQHAPMPAEVLRHLKA